MNQQPPDPAPDKPRVPVIVHVRNLVMAAIVLYVIIRALDWVATLHHD